MSTSSNARAMGPAALAYTLLAIAYTWPLPANMLHGVAHDAGDPILNAWILWWTTQAVPLTASWWKSLSYVHWVRGMVAVLFLMTAPCLSTNLGELQAGVGLPLW